MKNEFSSGKEAFLLHPGNAAHKICKSYEIQVIRMVEHLCMIALAFVHWSGRTKLVNVYHIVKKVGHSAFIY